MWKENIMIKKRRDPPVYQWIQNNNNNNYSLKKQKLGRRGVSWNWITIFFSISLEKCLFLLKKNVTDARYDRGFNDTYRSTSKTFKPQSYEQLPKFQLMPWRKLMSPSMISVNNLLDWWNLLNGSDDSKLTFRYNRLIFAFGFYFGSCERRFIVVHAVQQQTCYYWSTSEGTCQYDRSNLDSTWRHNVACENGGYHVADHVYLFHHRIQR